MLTRFIPQTWQRYISPGKPGRATTQRELNVIYGTWLFALLLKLIGSTWDVAWHFHFLRDDFAAPHNINTVGTMYVFMLVLFHTWTGFGIDRTSLRWMQAGIFTFLLAIPLDLINHRLFGLDITSWSPTHMMLYMGTVIMIIGVLRGWYLYSTSKTRNWMGITFWAFLLEGVLFSLGQHEYGVLSLANLLSGQTTAGPELLAEAYRYGNGNPVQFILPVPMWIYPAWLLIMGGTTLLLARCLSGWHWAATTVTLIYVGFRILAFHILQNMGFPGSALPLMLIAGALIIDLAVTYRWRPSIGVTATLLAVYLAAQGLEKIAIIPTFSLAIMPLIGACFWLIWVTVEWIEAKQLVQRWMVASV